MGYLNNEGLAHLWQAVKDRSLPVRAVTQKEYDALSEQEKQAEVQYIIFNVEEISDWWSPKMTDYEIPSPFVVSATSFHGSLFPWHAFDGTPSIDGYGKGGLWSSKDNAGPSYVQIDLGTKVYISKVKINPGYSIYGIQTPPNLYVSGSNDGENWEVVFSDDNVTWAGMGKYSEFTFDKIAGYRYFRFGSISVSSSDSFNGRTGYGDIQFFISTILTISTIEIKYKGKTIGGHGLPPGGTTGQALVKASDADYDAEWSDAPQVGSSGGEVYSTEETRIGTWIDGKPLYRLTVLVQNITISGDKSIKDISEYHIDDVVSCFGGLNHSHSGYGGNGFVALNTIYSGGTSYSLYLATTATQMLIRGDTSRLGAGNLNVTIEYTKTTD